jgi:DNA-binding transcriptional regulator YhcF (GntR family)
MLNYIFPSKNKRLLIKTLFLDGYEGSIRKLAQKAGVSFSIAYNELTAMQQEKLVVSKRIGSATIYKANTHNPKVKLLTKFVIDISKTKNSADFTQETERLFAQLVTMGLPFVSPSGIKPTTYSKTEAVVRGLELAQQDARVGSVFPVLINKVFNELEKDNLVDLAKELGHHKVLGFFLELTSEITNNPEMKNLAEQLFDKRWKKVSDLFHPAHKHKRSQLEENLTDLKTPRLAKKWNFRMLTTLDDFKANFRKHA